MLARVSGSARPCPEAPEPLRGMTWSHPRSRGTALALATSAEEVPTAYPRVDWESRDLAGCEFDSISDLAATYDLIVLDHPVLGDAAAAPALTPVDEIVSPSELRAWRVETIGGAYDSFNDLGAPSALPIDAAAQVAAVSETAFDDVDSRTRFRRSCNCLKRVHVPRNTSQLKARESTNAPELRGRHHG